MTATSQADLPSLSLGRSIWFGIEMSGLERVTMIKQVIIVNRLPQLSRAEFLDHWRNTHAPLIQSLAATLGIHRYVQLCPMAESSPLAAASKLDCDGIAEVWFHSAEAVLANGASPEAREAMKQIREDEELFIDRTRTHAFWGEEAPVI